MAAHNRRRGPPSAVLELLNLYIQHQILKFSTFESTFRYLVQLYGRILLNLDLLGTPMLVSLQEHSRSSGAAAVDVSIILKKNFSLLTSERHALCALRLGFGRVGLA